MMVPVPLQDILKLNRLVGEVHQVLGRLGCETGEPHPVTPTAVDPDTGREIPVPVADLTYDSEDDPEVEYREVGLGTPT